MPRTLAQAPVKTARAPSPREWLWAAELEYWAGVRGLPFEPWPLAAAVFPSAAARSTGPGRHVR